MKVSLIVAQGVHEGKVIPITTAQFLIGRDPHCNLRPASPSVSKQHAGLFVRGEKVFLKDYGSTNGSFVNGEQLTDECEVKNDDKLKIGPLEFVLRVEVTVAKPASSPGLKPASAPGLKAGASTVKPAPVAVAAAVTAPTAPVDTVAGAMASSAGSSVEDDNSDDLAAMMLMDDLSGSGEPTAEQSIPDGTTVMDIPAVDDPAKAKSKLDKIKEDAKSSSDAAKDILRMYMNRPRNPPPK